MQTFSRYLIGLFLLLGFALVADAQTITSVQAKIVEDDLVVTYNVSGILTTQRFKVELYGSHNDFATPLTGEDIQGKVGDRVALDPINEIVIKNPLEVVEGVTNISFRVRLDMVSYPVTVIRPSEDFKQRRKRNMEVIWRGGLVREPVSFDLYRYDELVKDNFFTTTNSGNAEFKMPKVDKGDGYVMKMEFNSLPEDVALPPMKVKAKKSVFGRVFGWSLLLAAVDFALYAASPADVPQEELGGFFWKNFDPMNKGLGIDDPIENPDPLPDPPQPGSSAMFSIRF